MRLRGRTALVTGGGRGIGAAVAAALAREGAAVAVAARTLAEVQRVAEDLRAAGHAAGAFRCDVTDPDDVGAMVDGAERSLGPIDVLVNNAGGTTSDPIPRITVEAWRNTLDVNATGTFLCTRAVLPGMLERGFGRIVNVASVAGLEGARYVAAYTAAKHAVVGFTRATAAEVRGKGITANAVCPGYVETPMTEATLARIREKTGMDPERALARMLEEAGQPRLIRPDEVAALVADLAADPAGSRNGRAIRIDGSGGGTDAATTTTGGDGEMGFQHLNPAALGIPRGWTNGMLAPAGGRILFVAGQDAADADGSVGVDDFIEQFGRALGKAMAVVREAGGGPGDVGRMTVFVTSVAEYRERRGELGPVWREHMGRHYPAMALVEVAALVDPRARVEVELTAVVPGG